MIVGTGIRFPNHLTNEAQGHIQTADKVFYLVADLFTERYIKEHNPGAENLGRFYAPNRPRLESYHNMAEAILEKVRLGKRVCAVFYGHPGVFVSPSHEAIRLARSEGYEAKMLPGISSEDCLFADLGIDPGTNGCQSYEATDFLVHRRKVDTSSALILWQAGVVGRADAPIDHSVSHHIGVLAEVLQELYGNDHEVVAYETSPYMTVKPTVTRTTMGQLTNVGVRPMATLYIPPKPSALDAEMVARLGLTGMMLPLW